MYKMQLIKYKYIPVVLIQDCKQNKREIFSEIKLIQCHPTLEIVMLAVLGTFESQTKASQNSSLDYLATKKNNHFYHS